MNYLLSLLAIITFSLMDEPMTRLKVDIQASTIYWKGTKMRRLGKHEGTLQLQSGTFEMKDGKVIGGAFTIDMTSIRVTDIPAHETVPIKNLTEHLKSEDFFAVERFPTSEFKLTKIQFVERSTYVVVGDLTIRGITHNIDYNANIEYASDGKVKITGNLELDRQRWDVAFKGMKDMVVDDTMYLRLEVISE